MINILNLLIIVFLFCVSVYTISYGIWTWRRKNRSGAFVLFLIAISVVVLPGYVLLFRY